MYLFAVSLNAPFIACRSPSHICLRIEGQRAVGFIRDDDKQMADAARRQ